MFRDGTAVPLWRRDRLLVEINDGSRRETATSQANLHLGMQEEIEMKRIVLTTFAAAGLMMTALNAQEVKARQENQQDRIAQGVQSGQLTAGETANLEHKEAKLNREVRRDRRANGGNLTNKEKVQINRQQNRLSRQIYRKKHNGRTQ
jgi:hypothetical protein